MRCLSAPFPHQLSLKVGIAQSSTLFYQEILHSWRLLLQAAVIDMVPFDLSMYVYLWSMYMGSQS